MTPAQIEAALDRIDGERLAQLIGQLASIPSPTGKERPATRFIETYLAKMGLSVSHSDLQAESGAVVGSTGSGTGGKHILLYAPIDTHLDEGETANIPWVGTRLRKDMVAGAERLGTDYLIGLGASNPKSMAAIAIEATHAILDAGLTLPGKLSVASAGGGMPWLPDGREGAGLSSGIRHLLTSGLTPDAAVIIKPWDDVYYEHPGLVWIKVQVHGDLAYAGLPHGIPGFRNSILGAAKLMIAAQKWLESYPQTHETQQVRPEGWIGAVRAGWPEKPAFPPAISEFWIDLRITPDQTIESVREDFFAFIEAFCFENRDIEVSWDIEAAVPATRTDPKHWIVENAINAWEAQHRTSYPGAPPMAGQTDAATMAHLGVPTVRVGFPFLDPDRTPEGYREGLGGMGVAFLPDLVPATQMVVRLALNALGEDG